MILVTGGAGFIGANFVLDWLAATGEPVVNLDKLTYAGNLGNLNSLARRRPSRVRARRHRRPGAGRRAAARAPAARDRQLRRRDARRPLDPRAGRVHRDQHRRHLQPARRDARRGGRRCRRPNARRFRFLHVSTDEVYGSLAATDPAFSETTAYAPNSPYSASKAASDHLVRAYRHTYGLPTLTTNCSNNYGPRQFPEKLIPLMIVNALAGKPLPVYGDGQNVRDWLYVGDHCSAIRAVLAGGRPGETYNIGGNAEMKNVDVVRELCAVLGEERPGRDFASLDHVRDRSPGTRPPLRDRFGEDPARAAAGRRRRHLRPGCGARSAGTSPTRTGSRASRPRTTRSGSRSSTPQRELRPLPCQARRIQPCWTSRQPFARPTRNDEQ